MKPAGLENGQGIITAYYLKDPTDPQWANDKDFLEWKAFMAQVLSQRQSGRCRANVYGYAVANLLTDGAQAMRRRPDARQHHEAGGQSEGRRAAAWLLPGIKVNTSPTDFYPIQSVQLARFKGESWELFGDVLSNEASQSQ